jgi:hypothetical protein
MHEQGSRIFPLLPGPGRGDGAQVSQLNVRDSGCGPSLIPLDFNSAVIRCLAATIVQQSERSDIYVQGFCAVDHGSELRCPRHEALIAGLSLLESDPFLDEVGAAGL